MVFCTIKGVQSSKDKRTTKYVFGVYDYMPTTTTSRDVDTYGYQRKTEKQFLDFIKKRVVDQKYDFSIKQILLILDNASIYTRHGHNSKLLIFIL